MLKQVRRCLLWFLETCVLLLFYLGLAVLVDFVIVHPRPPECEVVSLTLTQFSASNFNLSYSNSSSNETIHHEEHEAGSSSGPIQRIGTFYDHEHVRVMYHCDVVGENMAVFPSPEDFQLAADAGGSTQEALAEGHRQAVVRHE